MVGGGAIPKSKGFVQCAARCMCIRVLQGRMSKSTGWRFDIRPRRRWRAPGPVNVAYGVRGGVAMAPIGSRIDTTGTFLSPGGETDRQTDRQTEGHVDSLA